MMLFLVLQVVFFDRGSGSPFVYQDNKKMPSDDVSSLLPFANLGSREKQEDDLVLVIIAVMEVLSLTINLLPTDLR
jgi:hypothetical protein